MFDLVQNFVHMQQLAYGNSEITFGASNFSDASDGSGNTAGEWNYG